MPRASGCHFGIVDHERVAKSAIHVRADEGVTLRAREEWGCAAVTRSEEVFEAKKQEARRLRIRNVDRERYRAIAECRPVGVAL